MRYITSIILAIFLSISSFTAKAQEFSYGGFLFDVLDEKTCEFKITRQMTDTVTVPSKAIYRDKEYDVVSIAKESGSLNYMIPMKSINIPSSVKSISDWAFFGCMNLTEIILPNSILKIGKYSFSQCQSLKSITFSDNLESIGDSAFIYCNGLKGLVVPPSVKEIGRGAFSNCIFLENIDIQGRIENLSSEMFADDGSLASIKLPNTLIKIESCAFANCESLKNITLPNSVQFLEDKVFWGCRGLGMINIPNSLQTVTDATFDNILNLKEFKVNNENLSFCSIDGILYSKNGETIVKCPAAKKEAQDLASTLKYFRKGAFMNSSLITIRIPSQVTDIPDSLFYDSKLETIFLSENLLTLGKACFKGTKISSVILPQTLVSIGAECFDGCPISSVILPSTLTFIGKGAFNATQIEKISIPSTVENIQTPAFKNVNMTEINVEESNDNYRSIEGVLYSKDETILYECPYKKEYVTLSEKLTKIEDYSFSGSNLRLIQMPHSIIYLGKGAFSRCYYLEYVELSDGISEIPPYTFEYCQSLSSIKFPKGIKIIGGRAFYECQQLSELIFPEELEVIDWGAFWYCKSLREVRFGDAMKKIEAGSFSFCENLVSVWLPNSPDCIIGEAFSDLYNKNLTIMYSPSPIPLKCSAWSNVIPRENYSKATLFVPVGCVDVYASTSPWSKFSNICEMSFSDVGEIVEDNRDTKIFAMDGSIIIENNDSLVEVIDMNGQTLYKGFTDRIDNLMNGVYIIRIGKLIKKVKV